MADPKQARDDVSKYKEALRWSRRWYQFMPRQMKADGHIQAATERDNDYYDVFFGSQLGKYRGEQVFDKKKMMLWNRGVDAKQWYKLEQIEEDKNAPPIPAGDYKKPEILIYRSPPQEAPPKEKKVKKESNNFLGVTKGLKMVRPKKKNKEEELAKKNKVILPENYKLDLQFAENVMPDNFNDYVLEKLTKGEALEGDYKALKNIDMQEREARLQKKKEYIKKKEEQEKDRMTLEKLAQQKITKSLYVRNLEKEKGYLDEDELRPRFGPGTGNVLGFNSKLGNQAVDKPTRLLFLFLQAHPEFSNNDHSTNLFTEKFEQFKEEQLKKHNYRNDFI